VGRIPGGGKTRKRRRRRKPASSWTQKFDKKLPLPRGWRAPMDAPPLQALAPGRREDEKGSAREEERPMIRLQNCPAPRPCQEGKIHAPRQAGQKEKTSRNCGQKKKKKKQETTRLKEAKASDCRKPVRRAKPKKTPVERPQEQQKKKDEEACAHHLEKGGPEFSGPARGITAKKK